MSAEAEPGAPAVYGITRKQLECLYIVQELCEAGAPSIDEIVHEMPPLGRSNVYWHLARLRERGYITWCPHKWRSIKILHPVPPPEDFEFVVRVS